MANIFLINAHQPYPFSEGKLNASLVDQAMTQLSSAGHHTQLTTMTEAWDIDNEISKHQWADIIILQSPVNWMSVPWSMKKYMDEVYTYGMDGRLCDGDGRSRQHPERQYGSGGTLTGKQYMLSLTFNAPEESFNDRQQVLFAGASMDDLFFPIHANFQFFGMTALPTFACFDVMKNPQVETDFTRWAKHLASHIPS